MNEQAGHPEAVILLLQHRYYLHLMKRILLITCAFFFLAHHAWSQDVHYNQVIPGDTTKSKNILERLVFLAWQNNPDNQQKYNNAEGFKYAAKKTSWEWLNQIALSGNLNEFTLSGNSQFASYYPRYNIGVTIPLGIFFTTPYQIKQAKAIYHESLDRINSQKMDIRAHVTEAWETYRMYHREMTIQQQINENAYSDFLASEKKFKDGKISLTVYNSSLVRYSDILILKIVLEKNLAVSKSDLERLIGVRLERVISDSVIDQPE